MYVFHDESGRTITTMTCDPSTVPAGQHIEVPDDTDVKVGRDRVESGALVPVPLTEIEALAMERAAMRCSPMQGKLALGETMWATVEGITTDPATPFAMRIAITSTVEWIRTSQMMTELAWIMQLTDAQVDDLFRIAMQIEI